MPLPLAILPSQGQHMESGDFLNRTATTPIPCLCTINAKSYPEMLFLCMDGGNISNAYVVIGRNTLT